MAVIMPCWCMRSASLEECLLENHQGLLSCTVVRLMRAKCWPKPHKLPSTSPAHWGTGQGRAEQWTSGK